MLAGCQSQSLSQEKREAVWDPPMDAYVRCNYSTSRTVAAQNGDPVSLGLAVTRLCPGQRAKLMEAFEKTDGTAFAQRMMSKVDRAQVSENAATIVKARN